MLLYCAYLICHMCLMFEIFCLPAKYRQFYVKIMCNAYIITAATMKFDGSLLP